MSEGQARARLRFRRRRRSGLAKPLAVSDTRGVVRKQTKSSSSCGFRRSRKKQRGDTIFGTRTDREQSMQDKIDSVEAKICED